MCCVKSCLAMLAAGLLLVGCGDLTDDLNPSDKDQRPAVTAGSSGYMPGQLAPDFALQTSVAGEFQLSDYLSGGSQASDAVVLYFTMWCPICLAHSDHMYNEVIPQFRGRGSVVYALVDYVSGSVAVARAAETANGYAGSEFVTLVDAGQAVMDQFNAAMGTVVVIAPDATIVINEDYRNGEALTESLDGLLP